MDDYRIGDIVVVKDLSFWFGKGIITSIEGNMANVQFQGGSAYLPLSDILFYDV